LPGTRLSLRDRPPHLCRNLLVELERLAAIDLDVNHGANDTSAIDP